MSGGTLAVGGGVTICLTRMKRILEINTRDRYAIVEPGVVNVWLIRALAGTGFLYAPDSSQPEGPGFRCPALAHGLVSDQTEL